MTKPPFDFSSLLQAMANGQPEPKLKQMFEKLHVGGIPSDGKEDVIGQLIESTLERIDSEIKAVLKWHKIEGHPVKSLVLEFNQRVESDSVKPPIDGAIRKGLYLSGYDGEACFLEYTPLRRQSSPESKPPSP